MITRMIQTSAVAGLLLAIGIDPGWAQQRIKETGMDVVTKNNQVYELDKGRFFVLIRENGVSIAEGPTNPLHHTLVDCVGMVEELPDKTFRAEGYCTNTDKDGDKIFNRWSETTASAGQGSYELVGGTDKFVGAKGAGTWTATEVAPGPGRHPLAGLGGIPERVQVAVSVSLPLALRAAARSNRPAERLRRIGPPIWGWAAAGERRPV
jgi:hypothetical protein